MFIESCKRNGFSVAAEFVREWPFTRTRLFI